ncbi:hypothetical protein HHK36_012884 [Tetracentron sinense]|uniref:Pentatricopeptide repeat-containing protein n=1 Tax=Tetracentron sinense TaxID=13715 RepID=A0A834ZB62_TETSI|nr:hypothetical protein HHK36_012884 [Tetracentron sinense]
MQRDILNSAPLQQIPYFAHCRRVYEILFPTMEEVLTPSLTTMLNPPTSTQSELWVQQQQQPPVSEEESADCFQIFQSAEELNGVSITVILVGFAQTGLEEKALKLFVKIVKEGIEVDQNVGVPSILGVFGSDTTLALGKQIHSLLSSNPFVSNGLINMYSKCGGLGESIKVFNRMPMRNSVSWNSMIVAFARHGNGSRALQLYKEMRLEGVEPTDVTFISLLHACSHAGSIVEGFMFLESMAKAHRMSPRMEHYACVVGMVGRDVRCI